MIAAYEGGEPLGVGSGEVQGGPQSLRDLPGFYPDPGSNLPNYLGPQDIADIEGLPDPVYAQAAAPMVMQNLQKTAQQQQPAGTDEPPDGQAPAPDPGLNGRGYRPAAGDPALLARVIMSEVGNTPEAMNDVGWTIVNRVGRPGFRPDLAGVVSQPGQFDSLTNGQDPYWRATDPANGGGGNFTGPDRRSWERANAAAQGILNGTIPDGTNGATYFFSSPSYKPGDAGSAPSPSFQRMLEQNKLAPVSSYPNNIGTNRTYIFRTTGN
jgi:hypothetical protein